MPYLAHCHQVDTTHHLNRKNRSTFKTHTSKKTPTTKKPTDQHGLRIAVHSSLPRPQTHKYHPSLQTHLKLTFNKRDTKIKYKTAVPLLPPPRQKPRATSSPSTFETARPVFATTKLCHLCILHHKSTPTTEPSGRPELTQIRLPRP